MLEYPPLTKWNISFVIITIKNPYHLGVILYKSAVEMFSKLGRSLKFWSTTALQTHRHTLFFKHTAFKYITTLWCQYTKVSFRSWYYIFNPHSFQLLLGVDFAQISLYRVSKQLIRIDASVYSDLPVIPFPAGTRIKDNRNSTRTVSQSYR